ncbi:MAG TPA: ABC transporter substrate-binding protein, partial [Thermodesulfobacteriota bacterium]|nr:ABC transporter substrate-binding protein [Thermodesulfobacteriota bacterium]
MKRLRLLVLAAAAAITVFVSVTLSAYAAEADKTTLVGILNHAPRHFNGAVQSGVATMFPSAQLFASPLMFDDKWQPHPYLAKSRKISGDGLTVTLNLVKGATFHDGKPITSEDVAFSIMTIKNNHPFKTMFAPVSKVDTPDPLTAVIHLSQPHPAILLAMSQPLCPIIPKHIFGDG